MAPKYAMQFGGTLQRLAYCDRSHGPPLLAKLDLADGYYCVLLSSMAALHLAVVLPPDGQCRHLVALPLSLPMGWSHSPPYFCAYTETVADIINAPHLLSPLPPHPLQPATQQSDTLPILHNQLAPHAITHPPIMHDPLNYIDVYLDDFVLLTQQPASLPTINKVLHALHMVFRIPQTPIATNWFLLQNCKKVMPVLPLPKRFLGGRLTLPL